MSTSVIVAGARTPVGRFQGSLKDFSGAQLGGIAIKGALEKAKVAPSAVDYVIMGQVLTAGAGQIPARQAAVAGGIGMDVPALTINKVCLSGVDAIALADQLIRAGEFEVVVAGGQESMTNAPHLLPKSRFGFKYGDVTLVDHMAFDGLHDAFTDQAMGILTEQRNAADKFTREEQDEFAARSHQNAARAWKDGVFADEVVSVQIPQRKGDPIEFAEDEGIRADTTAASLAGLRPAFSKDGTITAGSSSPISDGACAVVVMSKERAEREGLEWIAEIGAHGVVAGPDSSLQLQPANAIRKACEREGISPEQLDLVEINEAFALVGLASVKDLGIDPAKVNVNGGAIAIGHPIGMSGARITLHLAQELKRRGGGIGVAALCGGGGQGDALIVRV
ncbi:MULTISPECIES: acetyl-CoA C-acetyltransferase [Mycobacteroides]|jgi:acetyl-CoA C-acetyltransferase|uniref:Probable acetyl-CoA acetyltransferase n=1 Tax=Mycobacteroides chelonae TaxID=1774 RepID=A0AB73TZR1_MYCCH|nr:MULTISPECIES: acetyl-CoA C-acetyltransferase [Mycobacteroides]AYM41420.1 acetyl-CoA C-acetyltransferase [[Mycobacterium] chelonae subsp. gwanakae]KRQ31462.1 acetyl-CoA acetyltransferase [Mycobacteroides sp. H072]KRQ35778.1 acetyl-CoA acetyltransferase [Mycobacteroides sp. H002]KRQ50681.1 acetyl-CoA acetyltransferase [Mycobacteroides sp. H054]KRQ72556.1 acetyl-CoA acetyltransferase [Mycobacteroides sp. H001]